MTNPLEHLDEPSEHLDEPSQAQQLVELFLPYLRLKSSPRTERVKEDVLLLLDGLVRRARDDPKMATQHLKTISLLFGTVRSGRRARAARLSPALPCSKCSPQRGAPPSQVRSRGARAALTRLFSTLVHLPSVVAGSAAMGADAAGAAASGHGAAAAMGAHRGAARDDARQVFSTAAMGAGTAAPLAHDDVGALQQAAAALVELNSFSTTEVDEPDYDRRLDTYSERLPALLGGVASARLVLPLLCHCIHDVELDDIALKHSASHSILLIVRLVARQPPGLPTAASLTELLERTLMPALRRGLRLPSEKDLLRQEFIRMLGTTLLEMPQLAPEMATLLSPHDIEADFYANVTHVQMPRRQRALARLAQRVESGAFSEPTLANYLVPMLRHLVLRSSPKEVDVAEEAVQTLRVVAARLPWRPYLTTLQAFVRLLKTQPFLEKRLVRAIVEFLNAFHFELTTDVIEDAIKAAGGGSSYTRSRSGVQRIEHSVARAAMASGAVDAPTTAPHAPTGVQQVAAGGEGAAAPKTEGEAEAEAEGAKGEEGEEGDEDEEGDDDEKEFEGDETAPLLALEAVAEAMEAPATALMDASAAGASSAVPKMDERSARAAAVMHAVRGKLLPELYAHLKDPKTEGVRVPVALAVLKLLLLMPHRILMAELHGFLMRVVQTLSSRNKGLRQQGRETLAKVTSDDLG